MRNDRRAAALGFVALVTSLLTSRPGWGALSLNSDRFGHWRFGGWTEGYAVVPIDMSTPRQLPESLTALQATGDIRDVLRVVLDARTMFGGPQMHATGFGLVNLRDTFQNTSPQEEIEEAYADVFLPSVDLRIGKQKFAWGKLDLFQPTDVVDPKRYTDPFIMSAEDQKIGIPAIRASYYPPGLGEHWPQDMRATLIWVPMPIPPRFPLQDERWFPAAYTVPATTLIPGSEFGPGAPDLQSTNTFLTANNPPPWQLSKGAIALRLNGLWHGTDWDLYYYNGLETAPAFALDTALTAPNPSDFGRCVLGAVPGPCEIQSTTVLRPTTGRIQLAGADAAFETHGIAVRGEGAFSTSRFLPRSVSELLSPDNLVNSTKEELMELVTNLVSGKQVPIQLGDLFVRRDIIDWGVAIEYPYRGWTPVLQLNQTAVLNNSTNLLVSNVDTRLLFAVRKSFFAEKLQTDTGLVQGVARGYTTGGVRFSYAITDALRARIGYLLIAGSRNTEIGQFGENDEAYVQLRYSF
jgi:hypothetical protein